MKPEQLPPPSGSVDAPPFGIAAVLGKWGLGGVLSLAAGLALVVLLFRRLGVRAVADVLKHSSLPLLSLAVAALLAFYLLRALRWGVILQWKVGYGALLAYSSIGYLVSSVAPAQAGELVKPALVRSRHGIPYSVTAASVAIERLLDVTTLVLIGAVAVAFIPHHRLGPKWIVAIVEVGGAVVATALLFLGLGSRWAEGVVRGITRMLSPFPIPSGIKQHIGDVVGLFLGGIGQALSPLTLACAMACGTAMWLINAASVALVFAAVMGPIPSHVLLLLGYVAFSLGLALPLTPAYVGQFEAMWLLVFAALHVATKADVLAAGVLCHSLILLTIAFLGLLSLGAMFLTDASQTALQTEAVPAEAASADAEIGADQSGI